MVIKTHSIIKAEALFYFPSLAFNIRFILANYVALQNYGASPGHRDYRTSRKSQFFSTLSSPYLVFFFFAALFTRRHQMKMAEWSDTIVPSASSIPEQPKNVFLFYFSIPTQLVEQCCCSNLLIM